MRIYDERGVHLRTVGGDGSGPGEFRFPNWIGRLGDTLAVLDLNQDIGRITCLTSGGDVIGTEPLRPRGGARTWPERLLPDGSLFQVRREAPDPSTSGPFRGRQTLVRWRNGDQEADTVATLAGPDLWVAEGDGVIWRPPFGRVTSIAIGTDPIVLGEGERFLIDGYDFDGRHRLRIRAAVPRMPITDELIPRWTSERTSGEWYRQQPGGVAGARRLYESMPRLEAVPAYLDLQVGRDGRLWAKRSRCRATRRTYGSSWMPTAAGSTGLISPAGSSPSSSAATTSWGSSGTNWTSSTFTFTGSGEVGPPHPMPSILTSPYPRHRFEGFHGHFEPVVPPEALDQALAYAARFPEEVDSMIRQNERVERMVRDRG